MTPDAAGRAAAGRDARWPDAVELLRAAVEDGRPVGLFAHVNPDSDTLGSALALGLALRGAGANAVVSFDADPFRLPDGLAFLPGQELLAAPGDLPETLDLVVTLDAAAPHMLGVLAERMAAAAHTLVVDHHRASVGFGELRLVDPDAPSTSTVVLELLDRLGLPLDAAVATALYAGLATDTGSFRQATTSPAAHRAAARLVEAGADPTVIGWSVWGIHRFAYLGLLAEVLGRAGLAESPDAGGHRLAWTYITHADLARRGLRLEHVEGVVDVLWGVLEADLAAVAKELPDGRWTVSLRSRGPIDVGAVAMGLGGGGHREKAGFLARRREPVDGEPGGAWPDGESRVREIVAGVLDQVRLASGHSGAGPLDWGTVRVTRLSDLPPVRGSSPLSEPPPSSEPLSEPPPSSERPPSSEPPPL
ncbi:bifunctional oligoribonuclease/PAP phosphatase NrnA [Frankia sp. CNm7]|uniref:Bifunctional oligoribonuclease/PAP phosphatase NrnA n=1 Tax=Frankia nepalensis TaxID=1836974 RepID=A0A937RAT6_9ACTN|nr:bifunctional oligoribonuclease/PAP phosphatase NrnA [Frankia nepalensis]MBL7501300.1 bifunctional oligoribonuclease/PAP phosphatase NrnA [Frankia nepalensis]MBL7515911.1 bifunctional oligoribonuclease/PAP phosphatase NrnA [Frankia nepalensis]MBL7519403.1 bifunctional oligoribonuclease/PAP phosphatase NrnA [Frankia nepalensis]MBL7628626.1 bifunctional oligoribonuclease/PAP phosphatase NrnA [Frankia nepalensis]